jgi:fatty-acyl-CoA synthase
MINAYGYKVWPAEVEAKMFEHSSIRECCIIGSPDTRRGETVKAVVVLKDGVAASDETSSDILNWAKSEMAAYKVPRKIEFVAELPRSPTGKVDWRQLQRREIAS